MEKLEWWDYPMGKNFEDICNRLHTIPACDGWTDGQTDILPTLSADIDSRQCQPANLSWGDS